MLAYANNCALAASNRTLYRYILCFPIISQNNLHPTPASLNSFELICTEHICKVQGPGRPNFKSKLFNGTINVPSAFMKERIKKRKQIAQSNDSFRAFVFICMADGSRVVRVCNKRYIIHYTYKHLRYEFVGVLTPFIMWNERKIKMSTAYWYSMDKVRRCKMSTVRR